MQLAGSLGALPSLTMRLLAGGLALHILKALRPAELLRPAPHGAVLAPAH